MRFVNGLNTALNLKVSGECFDYRFSYLHLQAKAGSGAPPPQSLCFFKPLDDAGDKNKKLDKKTKKTKPPQRAIAEECHTLSERVESSNIMYPRMRPLRK